MSTAIERRSVYRRTEDIYRKAIEDIRDYAIFMMDLDGVVTNWNVGAQHILGYTEEDDCWQRCQQVFHTRGPRKECSREKSWQLLRQ